MASSSGLFLGLGVCWSVAARQARPKANDLLKGKAGRPVRPVRKRFVATAQNSTLISITLIWRHRQGRPERASLAGGRGLCHTKPASLPTSPLIVASRRGAVLCRSVIKARRNEIRPRAWTQHKTCDNKTTTATTTTTIAQQSRAISPPVSRVGGPCDRHN